VGEDVGPRVPSQHEEHQDKDQSKEVNIDPPDTFVLVVSLKKGFDAEGHGNTLEAIGVGTFSRGNCPSIRMLRVANLIALAGDQVDVFNVPSVVALQW
jgi:hypothetical protein